MRGDMICNGLMITVAIGEIVADVIIPIVGPAIHGVGLNLMVVEALKTIGRKMLIVIHVAQDGTQA